MAKNQALEAAFALAINPSLETFMRQALLPNDVSTLLRFLAGELSASEITSGDPALLPDTIERYVFAIMLYPGASPMRILGVADTASRSEMRAHMRLLMVWLHPDRAGRSWRSAYSTRVLEAWRQVSAAPQDARPPQISLKPSGRPHTKAVRLAWVARPVARRPSRRFVLLGRALIVVVAVAAITAFNNPLRQWAESAINGNAPGLIPTETRPSS